MLPAASVSIASSIFRGAGTHEPCREEQRRSATVRRSARVGPCRARVAGFTAWRLTNRPREEHRRTTPVEARHVRGCASSVGHWRRGVGRRYAHLSPKTLTKPVRSSRRMAQRCATPRFRPPASDLCGRSPFVYPTCRCGLPHMEGRPADGSAPVSTPPPMHFSPRRDAFDLNINVAPTWPVLTVYETPCNWDTYLEDAHIRVIYFRSLEFKPEVCVPNVDGFRAREPRKGHLFRVVYLRPCRCSKWQRQHSQRTSSQSSRL